MQVSFQLLFQNTTDKSDAEFYAEELRLAELAEPLGFDAIWCVEHHFDGGYSMCPDNLVLLAYLAGKTKTIKLVTGGVILPWNNPLRVAEKVALLDCLSQGRFVLGLGRGLSQEEFGHFGIEMSEARERFDESAPMILEALETGTIKGDGPFFPQPEAPIRPAPTGSFRDRVVCIAMSADSRMEAAQLGAAMATFMQYPAEQHRDEIEGYRAKFREVHGTEAPTPTLSDCIYCSEDPADAEETSKRAIAYHFAKTAQHYNLGSGHFAKTKGYESYDALSMGVKEAGLEAVAEGYWQAQMWGTPEQIVEKIKGRLEVIGDHNYNAFFSYGGLTSEQVERSMRLVAKEVIPEVKKLAANL